MFLSPCRHMCLTSGMALIAISLVLTGSRSGAHGQGTPADQKKIKLAKPQDVTLDTKDGWSIRCTYFPGGVIQRSGDKGKEELVEKPGKKVVPVVLLHGMKGQRSDYESLAQRLQKEGHAVLVPDLRGHGESTSVRLPNGSVAQLEFGQLKPLHLSTMLNDLLAVKRFLVRENNAEKLNVEQLCVVGADLGSILALNWALYDWMRPSLPSVKLGQDIKAIALLSPEQNYKSIHLREAIANPVVRGRLAVMIAVGEEDAKALSEAKSIYNKFERYHPNAAEQPPEERDLFFIPLKTTLQGTKMFTSNTLPIQDSISTFIRWRIDAKADQFEWTKRENPLSSD